MNNGARRFVIGNVRFNGSMGHALRGSHPRAAQADKKTSRRSEQAGVSYARATRRPYAAPRPE